MKPFIPLARQAQFVEHSSASARINVGFLPLRSRSFIDAKKHKNFIHSAPPLESQLPD